MWFDNSSASNVAGSCLAYYSRSGNAMYLLNDAGSAWLGPVGMGTAGTLSNSQCTINTAASSVSNVSGTDNVVNLAVTFASSFSGTKNVKMHVEGSSGYNGWQIMGTWTVPGVAVVVAPVSVTPSSGNVAQQTFNLRYSDTAGINDLSTEWVWFDNSSASNVAGSCLAYYSRSGNALYLLNDAGSAWLGPVGVGTAGTLSNSQCAINTAATSVSNVSSTDNVVNLAVTFASSFSGTKNVKMHVEGSSGYNGVADHGRLDSAVSGDGSTDGSVSLFGQRNAAGIHSGATPIRPGRRFPQYSAPPYWLVAWRRLEPCLVRLSARRFPVAPPRPRTFIRVSCMATPWCFSVFLSCHRAPRIGASSVSPTFA